MYRRRSATVAPVLMQCFLLCIDACKPVGRPSGGKGACAHAPGKGAHPVTRWRKTVVLCPETTYQFVAAFKVAIVSFFRPI